MAVEETGQCQCAQVGHPHPVGPAHGSERAEIALRQAAQGQGVGRARRSGGVRVRPPRVIDDVAHSAYLPGKGIRSRIAPRSTACASRPMDVKERAKSGRSAAKAATISGTVSVDELVATP